MARLPKVGSDSDQWGTLLNEFLLVSHAEDGTLRDNLRLNIVGSITALQRLNTSQYNYVIVMGYHVANDGGGGLYSFDPLNTADPNGGTIVAPDIGVGRWLLATQERLNVKQFGAVGDNSTLNDSAFENAIEAANVSRQLLFIPAGTYKFGRTSALPTLTSCPGMIGVSGNTTLEFVVDGDCIVSKGGYKIFSYLYINNRHTTFTHNSNAVLRIKNCAYGNFADLNVNSSGANGSCIMLEQEYTGAEDEYLLKHLGCWYNTFSNISCIYINTTDRNGYGLDFFVNTNAKNVQLPGETQPIYGSVNFNTVIGVNIESKARGINLDTASANVFIGGLIGGCKTAVYGRSASSANVFVGQRYNQWIDNVFDLDDPPNTRQNVILAPILFSLTPQPWSLGKLGEVPTVLSNNDAAQITGLLLRGGIYRPDGAGVSFLPGNGTNTHFADIHRFVNGIGDGVSSGIIQLGADVKLYRNGTALLRTDGKFVAADGIGYANLAAASSLGKVTAKVPVYDDAGNLRGYLPVYDAVN